MRFSVITSLLLAAATEAGIGQIVNPGSGGSGFITSLTTTGTSGPSTVVSGVLNIPQYSGGGGATIPSTTNLISGSGTGNGADSGIAPSNVGLLTTTTGNVFTNTTSSAFVNGLAGLCSNLTASQQCLFTFGRDAGTRNAALWGFTYAGNGSTSNYQYFSFGGISPLMNIFPNGHVTINHGAADDGFNLGVVGTGNFTGALSASSFSGSGASITSLDAGNISAGTLAQARGGTGVANTATLTLGTTNQNWATLGTGIVKNTTTTGALSIAIAADFPTLNQTTTGTAAGLTGCTTSTAGSICYWNGSAWVVLAGNASGTQYLQETSAGVPSWTTPSGSGNTTSTSLTTNALPKANGANSIINSLFSDDGTTGTYTGSGGFGVAGDGVHSAALGLVGNTTVPASLGTNNSNIIGPNSASFTSYGWQMPSTTTAGVLHVGPPSGNISQLTISAIVGSDMTNNTVTATQLAAQYSKGSCTEAWGGSGASFALTSGDDAVSNNTCYNDSGVTRTITAVKCRSSAGSNTTTVNPTFGSAGTGTTILSGALTCGSTYAYSSTGTVSNASWTTGTGINPAMAGTLTGTSIAMIVEYTY